MSQTKKYYLPAEDVNEETATIVELFFNTGDKVVNGDLIYSFETTKTMKEVECEGDGYIYYYVTEGENITIGSLVCEVSQTKKKLTTVPTQEAQKKDTEIKPTKKAQKLTQKYNLNIEKLGLKGIIREKDLIPFIKEKQESEKVDRCLELNRKNHFIKKLLEDESFKKLSSEEKIAQYRKNGYEIGDNVQIEKGALLIGNKISLRDNVIIGKDTYIEAPEIIIGKNTTIGSNCELVGSIIRIGDNNTVAPKVYVDISGGRFPDSNLKTGRGCLIAYECYINICREVIIGEEVALSPRSMIFTHSYWQSILDGYTPNFGSVKLNDNCWIGSVSQILPNVTVGKGSIVISNSLVSGNVKPFTLVGGVPAKTIKSDIKKDNSDQVKNQILRELFSEFYEWIFEQNYDVEKINNNLIKIYSKEGIKTFLFLEDNLDPSKYEEMGDIVLSLDTNGSIPKYAKTILTIKNKSVEGKIENVEFTILEFFRRKGIRFYEK